MFSVLLLLNLKLDTGNSRSNRKKNFGLFTGALIIYTYLLVYVCIYKRKSIYYTNILFLYIGLTIAFSCLEGDFSKMSAESQAAKNSLRASLREEGVKGFADVVVSNNVTDGICHV